MPSVRRSSASPLRVLVTIIGWSLLESWGCDAPRPADGWPSGKAERSEPGLSLAADYGRPSARVPREQPAPGGIAGYRVLPRGQLDYSAEVAAAECEHGSANFSYKHLR